MQKAAAGFFTAPFVKNQIEAARQQHVGGTDIGIGPVPVDQRDLVQRRGGIGVIGKERPRARPALNPQIAVPVVALQRVIAAVEPLGNLERILPLVIGPGLDMPLGVHVQQHRRKRPHRAGVQPVGQGAQRPRLAERIDQKFIDIDRQAPMTMAIAPLQMRQPIHPERRRLVAGRGGPDRHVRLLGQIFAGAVVAGIVDEQKVVHPQIAVIAQKIRQPDPLIPHGGQRNDRRRPDPHGAVHHGFQVAPMQEGTQMGTPTPRAQSDCPNDAHPQPPYPRELHAVPSISRQTLTNP